VFIESKKIKTTRIGRGGGVGGVRTSYPASPTAVPINTINTQMLNRIIIKNQNNRDQPNWRWGGPHLVSRHDTPPANKYNTGTNHKRNNNWKREEYRSNELKVKGFTRNRIINEKKKNTDTLNWRGGEVRTSYPASPTAVPRPSTPHPAARLAAG